MSHFDPSKVFLDIRTSAITENEERLLSLSHLDEIAPVEFWTAWGTNQQMAYSTHGAFRYFGKFPPPIATHLLQRYTAAGDTVYDPMCGSGTTGVEALLNGRDCILNDVSPLSTLLAKVKTTPIEEHLLRNAVASIRQNYRPLTYAEYAFAPVYLRNYEHWFLPETTDSLRGIKFLIEQTEHPDIKDFLNVCFAATVRRVSRATTQQGRLFLDAATAEKDALPFFLKRAEIAIAGVSTLPKGRHAPQIYSYDLRTAAPEELMNRADLVICHPPYFNSYKYSSINSLELAWLDINYAALRRQEVREFFKVGKEENAQYYVSDMVQVLLNLHPTLKSGRPLALMIGDTTIHGNYIPVTRQILDQVGDYYDIELAALRVPKYTEATWVASQRRTGENVGISLCDFVIVLRKKP